MKNERRIRNNLCEILKFKLEKSNFNHLTDDIKTSVDFVIKCGKTSFLFEVDSNNVAKSIFGQYLLLNKARDLPENPFLIIIHCYKKYNIERTKKHLRYTMEVYNCKIPFAVFSKDEWNHKVKNKSSTQMTNFLKSLAK
jgi:hypothetical protein